jgi:2,4-dienoyl-CoA reductase-like NADH-dependent reductase (Old Yellow Enzyme family)
MELSRRDFIKKVGVTTGAVAVAGSFGAVALAGCSKADDGAVSTGTGAGSADTGTNAAQGGNSAIFQPTKIGSLELKNKIFKAAMGERLGDPNNNFSPNPALVRMYGEDAAGGTAMIITGMITLIREEQVGNRSGFYGANQIPDYKKATDHVHDNGGKICAQLVIPGIADGRYSIGKITKDDIKLCAETYAQGALWAREAGFDAVEILYAQYLLEQFFSPVLNVREDEYNGAVENRTRFAFEILEAVRNALGRDFPLIAKVNSNEHEIREGSTQEDTNYYVQGLVDRGIDAVDITGTGKPYYPIMRDILSREDQNYFSRNAREIAKSVDVPMILTSGIRNIDMMEEALKYNRNLIGFGMVRTLNAEPDLANQWQKDLNHTPVCISCNWCRDNLGDSGIACTFNKDRNK